MYFEVILLSKKKKKTYLFVSAHASLQYTYHNSGEKQCAKLGLLLWLYIQHRIVFAVGGKIT